MILNKGSFEEITSCIQEENAKIVVYGAGMIGKTVLPYWIKRYRLENEILYYVDIDESKWGGKVEIGGVQKTINGIEKMLGEKRKFILLITNSNFSVVLKSLDVYPQLKDIEAYIVPIMLLENSEKESDKIVIRESYADVQIPKKIHYCWFSGNPIPYALSKCIESWEKYCPDYEIIRWDESNYDFSWNLYMTQAYEAKKWGFVPDVARLDILYRYGGIYLDTDVELIRGLDDLLQQPGFCGVEKWGNVNIGSCAGAVAGHPVIKELLDFRKNEVFLKKDGKYNLETCGYYETTPLIRKGYVTNNRTQRLEEMMVYSSDYFCPFDYMSMKTSITSNTRAIHHFSGGWLDEKSIEQRKQTQAEYFAILERMK